MKNFILETIIRHKIRKELKKRFPHKKFYFYELVDLSGNVIGKFVFYKKTKLFCYYDNKEYLSYEEVQKQMDFDELKKHIEIQDMLIKQKREDNKNKIISWIKF